MTRTYCDWCDNLLVGGDRSYSIKVVDRQLDISVMNCNEICASCYNQLVQLKKTQATKETIIAGVKVR